MGLESDRPIPEGAPPAQGENEGPVAGTGAALGDGERVDAAARGVRPDPEGSAEDGVVAVDEAEELVGSRVHEVGAGGDAAPEITVETGLLLIPGAGRRAPVDETGPSPLR